MPILLRAQFLKCVLHQYQSPQPEPPAYTLLICTAPEFLLHIHAGRNTYVCWGSLHSVPVRAKQTSTGRPAPVPDALTAVSAIENAGVNHHPGFKKHLLVLAASTLFVILVYTLFPVCTQRGTAPDRADCFADHLIIQRSSFAVTLIVDCTICADSEPTCGLYCVNMMVYK